MHSTKAKKGLSCFPPGLALLRPSLPPWGTESSYLKSRDLKDNIDKMLNLLSRYQ